MDVAIIAVAIFLLAEKLALAAALVMGEEGTLLLNYSIMTV